MKTESLLESARLHWRRLLPIWLCSPLTFIFHALVLRRVSDAIAIFLFWAVVMPFSFWSFSRASALVMTEQLSIPRGMLLVLTPFLPLAILTLYLLRAIGAR